MYMSVKNAHATAMTVTAGAKKMSRYIDADEFLKEYCEPYPHVYMAMSKALADAPSIDICFCKECKFSARYVDDGHIECRLYSHPLRHDYHEMKPDDFCSYGDKRDD